MQYRNIEISKSLEWLMHEANSQTTARGFEYFFQNRVEKLSEKNGVYSGYVRGSEKYKIELEPENEYASCNCPAYFPCKHLISVVFFLSVKEAKQPEKHDVDEFARQHTASEKIPEYRRYMPMMIPERQSPPCELIFQLGRENKFKAGKFNVRDQKISPVYIEDQITYTNGKPLENVKLLHFAFYGHEEISLYELVKNEYLGRVRILNSQGVFMEFCGFLPIHQKISAIKVSESGEYSDEVKYRIDSFYYKPFSRKEVPIQTPADTDYDMKSHVVKIYVADTKKTKHAREPGLKENQIPFYVTMADESTLALYSHTRGGKNLLTDMQIVQMQDLFRDQKILNLKKVFPRIFNQGPVFSLSIYPDEKGQFKVKCRPEFIYAFNEKYLETEVLAKTISGKSAGKNLARFPGRPAKTYRNFMFQKDPSGNISKRDVEKEIQIFKKYEQTPIPFHKKEFVLKPGEISAFIEKEIPVLQKTGAKIHIHKDLVRLMEGKNNKNAVFKIHPKTNDIDWFGGQIIIEGMGLRDLRLALKAYRKKEDYFRLKDGSWISLESIGINKLARSFENLGIRISGDGEIKKINRGQMLAIELEMDNRTGLALENLATRIKNLPRTRKKHPEVFTTRFQGELRDYQKEGVLFLESLYEIGIGGILADDMGLGKTIQGLSFIDRLTMKNKSLLTLIVGPLASVSIWKKEVKKYFPDIQITLWHGSDRKKTGFPKEGIVLTTYGTLSRDYADWKERHHFDLVILDEAQNLKNFRSLSSHAVRQTNTRLYFCLTGTPLENSLVDLWSLFDICFPGYLGTQKSFSKIYSETWFELQQNLRKKIEPFVLRRTKDEVLKELPPITETLVPVTMTEKQRSFYEEARKQAILELANAGQNYLVIMLPHLMKLRRISCHPEPGNSANTDPLLSGKFQHVRDIIDELAISATGVLIFSQFTDILKICGRLLENLGYEFHYLDGSTSLKKREDMVNRFQAGEKKFFLISLKAGGTSLTLHRADTVIHLDPWWNPAVEKQASDRVHRIGQKQKVFVYKLYSENSIEEKVLELQSIKKELFDNIFGKGLEKTSQITREQLARLLES